MHKHIVVLVLSLFLFYGCRDETVEGTRFKPLSEDEKIIAEVGWREGSNTDQFLVFYAMRSDNGEGKRLLNSWEDPIGPAQLVSGGKGAFFCVEDPKLKYTKKGALFFIDGIKGLVKRCVDIPRNFSSSEDGRYLVYADYDYERQNPYSIRILLIDFSGMKEIASLIYKYDGLYGRLGVRYERVKDGNTIMVNIGYEDITVTRLEIDTKKESIQEAEK